MRCLSLILFTADRKLSSTLNRGRTKEVFENTNSLCIYLFEVIINVKVQLKPASLCHLQVRVCALRLCLYQEHDASVIATSNVLLSNDH